MDYDELDLRILKIIQKSSRSSIETISGEVGLSQPAVQRRLKKLRESKIITDEVALLSPKELGFKMTFIVSVIMEREQANILDSFKKRMIKHPNVQQCYYVTGQADFILILITKDMEEFEKITRELFMDNSHVRSFRTSITMGDNFTTLQLPL